MIRTKSIYRLLPFVLLALQWLIVNVKLSKEDLHYFYRLCLENPVWQEPLEQIIFVTLWLIFSIFILVTQFIIRKIFGEVEEFVRIKVSYTNDHRKLAFNFINNRVILLALSVIMSAISIYLILFVFLRLSILIHGLSYQCFSAYVNSPWLKEALAYLPSLIIWSLVFYVAFRAHGYYVNYKKNVEFEEEHL